MADKPLELKEYEYYVGHMLVTAMLTEEMAERLGAAPVGRAEKPTEGAVPNRTAEQVSSHTREAEDSGVEGDDPEALDKARRTRNRRAQ